jgi:hypothetical protein
MPGQPVRISVRNPEHFVTLQNWQVDRLNNQQTTLSHDIKTGLDIGSVALYRNYFSA